jgi:hypothetical protein
MADKNRLYTATLEFLVQKQDAQNNIETIIKSIQALETDAKKAGPAAAKSFDEFVAAVISAQDKIKDAISKNDVGALAGIVEKELEASVQALANSGQAGTAVFKAQATELQSLVQQVQNVTKSYKELTNAEEEVKQALLPPPAVTAPAPPPAPDFEGAKGFRAATTLGRTFGEINRVAGLDRHSGFAELGALSRIVGDFTRLGPQLERLGQYFQKMSGIIGTLSNGAGGAIANFTGLGVGLSAVIAVVAPLAIAAGIAAIALVSLNNTLSDVSKTLNQADAQTTEYYKLVEKGTQDSIIAQRKAAVEHQQALEDEIKTRRSALASGLGEQGKKLSEQDLLTVLNTPIEKIAAQYSPQVTKMREELDKLNEEYIKTTGQIEASTLALNNENVVRRTLIEMVNKEADAELQAKLKQIDLAQQYHKLIEEGTAKQVRAQHEQNLLNEEKLEAELTASRKKIAVDPTNQPLAEAHLKLLGQLQDLKEADAQLIGVVGPLVSLREFEKKAIEELNKALEKRAAQIEKQIGDEINLANFIRNASEDSVKDRLEQNKLEKETIEKHLDELKLLAKVDPKLQAQVDKYQDRLVELGKEYDYLSTEGIKLGREHDIAAAALKEYNRALQELPNNLSRAADLQHHINETIEKNEEETAKIREDRRIKEARAEEDYQRKTGEEKKDFSLKLSRADQDYSASRAEKVRKFYTGLNETQAKIEQNYQKDRANLLRDQQEEWLKHLDKLADLQRQRDEDLLDSAAHLNAEGVYQARRNYADKLNDENKQATQSREKAKAALEQKHDDEVKAAADDRELKVRQFEADLQFEDQKRTIARAREIQDFNEKQAREKALHLQEIKRQNEDYVRQDAERKVAFERSLADLRRQLNEVNNKIRHDVDIITGGIASVWLNNMSKMAKALSGLTVEVDKFARSADTGRARSSADPVSGYTRYMTPQPRMRRFASGGRPNVGEVGWVGENGPEPILFDTPVRVVSNTASMSYGGGLNIQNFSPNIVLGDIGSRSDPQVKEMIRSTIISTLRDAATKMKG